MLGYIGGQSAYILEKQNDNLIIEKTHKLLQTFFKKSIDFPESFFITRWSQDPWSLGSYSYLPVSASKQDRLDLAKPESNRLFFAGEASNAEFPATVHGAYLSGVREARHIVDMYQPRVTYI